MLDANDTPLSRNEQEPHRRTGNDVFGIGEAAKSIFGFFSKIVEKLPFQKLEAPQIIFIIILVIANLLISVLTLMKISNVNAFYVVLAFDLLMAWRTFSHMSLKKTEQQEKDLIKQSSESKSKPRSESKSKPRSESKPKGNQASQGTTKNNKSSKSKGTGKK